MYLTENHSATIKRYAISFRVVRMMADPAARNMESLFEQRKSRKRNGQRESVGLDCCVPWTSGWMFSSGMGV